MAQNLERDLSKSSILIVDDNPFNLDVLTDCLESEGFEVMAARSGESCLKIATATHPSLILLDVMMPGLDGFMTCRTLKKNQITNDISVIFMTALTNTEDKLKGFEEGAVDYITKPLSIKEVLARVNTHLRLKQLTETLEQTVKERTEELNRAYQNLEKLDQAKTDFIHVISHELRTPPQFHLWLYPGFTRRNCFQP